MITFQQLWGRQAAWSERTFGTERGPVGPLRHLLRELGEVASASPADAVLEWADVLILAIDAARRAGFACVTDPGSGATSGAALRGIAESLVPFALRGEFPQSRYADLIDATFDACAARGLSPDDLIAAAYVKVLINERRTWAAPDAEGVCEHVRADAAPEPRRSIDDCTPAEWDAASAAERRRVAEFVHCEGCTGTDCGEPDAMPASAEPVLVFSNWHGWIPRP